MLKHVTLMESPLDPKSWERLEVEDVREFLASRYSSFPPTARIYHGSVSFQTDVTPQDKSGIAALGEMPGPFYVVVYPEGGWEILVIGFILAAGAYMLMPSFHAPVVQPPVALARSNQQAASPNNDLSDRANRARINGRIPDIYGTVRSTPDLIAAPYKIFENGREVEYAYMCIGRGQYEITDVRDGETLVENIPGSSVMIYGPYTSPNSYDPADPDNTGPEMIIGEERIIPVLNAKRSNSVNGQVLRPPNSVNYSNAQSQLKFVYPNRIEMPEDSDEDFTKYFVEGDVVTVTGGVLTTDPITVNMNFYASTTALEYNYPGGTKYYPNDSDFPRLFFPASFADLLQPVLASGNITLDTGSVTSVGDIDGTYSVGAAVVVGPTTPEQQAANLPSFFCVDLSGASGVNPNWNNISGRVGFSSPITYSSAPFEIDLNGTYTIVSVTKGVIVLENPSAVNSDWEDVLSVEEETPFMNVSVTGTGDRWVGPFILEDTQLVEVYCNFVASNGLYKDDGTTQEAAEVTIEVELTPVGIDDEPLGPAQTFQTSLLGSTFLKESIGQTLKCHPENYFGRTAIRARRVTEADTVFEGLVVDEVRWRDAYSISYVSQSNFGNITTAFSITFATASALAVKERKLNMLAQRKLPSWDGSAFSTEFTVTNDAATILAAVCRDRYIGNRSMAEIDVANFFEAASAVETYFGTARAREFCYTFDKDQLSFEEIVNTIAQAMFCVAYRRGNVIRLNFEKDTEDSTLLFNHRNKLPGTEKRTVSFGVSQDNDGVQYTYVDPRDDSVATIFLPPDYAAINPKKIESVGVRNYLQAYFHVWRAWNKLQYQNVQVEFEATQEADLLVVNDRILVSDGTRPFAQEGEVLAVDGLELTLSQNVDLTADPSYVIFLQHYDGTVESIGITAGTDANQVVLGEAPALALVTGSEMTARTGYVIVGSADTTQKAFLVAEKSPADRMTSTVKAVNYDPRFYSKDSDYILGLIDEEAYGPEGNYFPDTGNEFPAEEEPPPLSPTLVIVHDTTPFITLYNLADMTKLSSPSPPPSGSSGQENGGLSAAFSPDGSLLAVGGGTSQFLTVYDTATWTSIAIAGGDVPGKARGVAFSSDGALLAVAHAGSPFVTIYDTDTWAKLSNPATLPAGTGNGIDFSPDGSLLAVAHSLSPFVTIYDTATWTKLSNPATLPAGTGTTARFSPDGSLLVVAHFGSPYITIYNTSTWAKLANPSSLPPFNPYSLAFNPDGSLLAVGNDASSPYLSVYSTVSWIQASPLFPPPDDVFGVGFVDGGDVLVTAHRVSPFITRYNASDLSLLAAPAELPAGVGRGVAVWTGGV